MIRLCIVLLFISRALFSQVVEIYDSAGKTILIFENDKLVEAESKKTFVTVTGNTVFDGESTEKRDILLLVAIENIFSKKKMGYALNSAQDEAIFSISNGRFFYKETKGQMAYYKEENEQNIVLYRDTSGKALCRVSSELSTGKLVAIFYYFMRKYELDKSVKVEITESAKQPATDVGQTSGSISRLWNTGVDEFVWDGQVFKRKWNSFDYEEWTFDGTTLKRLWYPGNEEFIWDGEILRRKWFTSPDEFEWDGTILRRRWGPASDEFIIQGNIVKRYFGSNSQDEWKIDGDIPIPLVALIVFGLLRK